MKSIKSDLHTASILYLLIFFSVWTIGCFVGAVSVGWGIATLLVGESIVVIFFIDTLAKMYRQKDNAND